jgi:hypothetical protein
MKTLRYKKNNKKSKKNNKKSKNKKSNFKRTIKKRIFRGGNVFEDHLINTPRKIYAKKYLGHEVFLIPSVSHNGYSLFQVNFSNEEQFKNYLNLSETETQNDCFFQSVYSLGLRDLDLAKKNSENIELHGVEGVDTRDVENYIKESFGLKKSVASGFVNANVEKWTEERLIEQLGVWLEDLKDNCGTLLFLTLSDGGGHFIVAYKYNNTIYYFDPQGTRQQDNEVIISTNIKDILLSELIQFLCFYIEDLTEKIPLIKNDCHVEFYG